MDLMGLSVREFTAELASSSPAPGGGTIAATCGAFAAGLGSMVCSLTLKKLASSGEGEIIAPLAEELRDRLERMLRLADEDTEAFNRVMAAFRLPKETETEQQARRAAIAEANLGATLVPMETARTAVTVCETLAALAGLVNENVLSDCGVAIECAHTAALGAFMNVAINLPGVKDAQKAGELAQELTDLKRQLETHCATARAALGKRFPY